MESILGKVYIYVAIICMTQKIINPFRLKPQEFYPGIIIRRDEVIIGDVTFNFFFSILYSYYISLVSAKISGLSFQNIRKIKSLCGIHLSVDVDDTAKAITKYICNDIFGLINVLTDKNTSYSLAEYILADINELPKMLFNIVRFVNSHKVANIIEGSGNSIIKWRNVTKTFDSTDLKENPDDYNCVKVLMKVNKLSEIMRELEFEEIVKVNTLSDLFLQSEFVLNGSVKHIDESSITFQAGDDFNRDDILMYILCAPKYTLNDSSFIQANDFTLTKNEIQQILRMPVHLLSDSNINLTCNDRLVNSYIESPLTTQSNLKLSFSQSKSSNISFNEKRNLKSKVKGKKDSLYSDLKSEVTNKLEVDDKAMKDKGLSDVD